MLKTSLIDIINEFDLYIKNYADKTNAKSYEVEPTYKNHTDINHLLFYDGIIHYDDYSLMYHFTVHNDFSVIHHTLECFISINNLFYPIKDVLHILDIKHTNVFLVPCLADKSLLIDAFIYYEKLLSLYPIIFHLNEYDKNKIINQFKKDILLSFKLNEEDIDYEELFYEYIKYEQIELVLGAYADYSLGQYDSFLTKLKKYKKTTNYQNYMLSNIQEGIKRDIDLPDSIQYILKKYNKNETIKTDKKEIISLFMSIIILITPMGMIMGGLAFILKTVLYNNSIYIIGLDNAYFETIFYPSFLSAIALSYQFRHIVYKLIFKKDCTEYEHMQIMNYYPTLENFMKLFSGLIIISGIIFGCLSMNSCIVFYDDYFIDKSGYMNLKGQYYQYEDIDFIRHYTQQYNGFNTLMDEENYVIYIKDKKIDLYYLEDIKELKQDFIPFLNNKGVNIIKMKQPQDYE